MQSVNQVRNQLIKQASKLASKQLINYQASNQLIKQASKLASKQSINQLCKQAIR